MGPAPEPSESVCPECGQPLPIAADTDAERCTSCGLAFTLDVFDDTHRGQPHGADAELDALRIRQLSALRRGAYRIRSYYVVGVVALAITAGDLLWLAFRLFRGGGRAIPAQLLLAALGAIAGVVFLWKRAQRLTAELRKGPAPEPTTPPDFSTLSDGSQQWRHLEQLEP